MWQAPWRWAPGYIGIGAFNLVRSSVYRSLGGHEQLRMEVVDDLMLGKLIKRSGHRQGLAYADQFVGVRWVNGLKGAVNGLAKNGFAGLHYSWIEFIFFMFFNVLIAVGPFIGLFSFDPKVTLLSLGAVISMFIAASFQRSAIKYSTLYALVWPLASIILFFIVLRSATLAELQGGIVWRDTFYPLRDLRRFRFRSPRV